MPFWVCRLAIFACWLAGLNALTGMTGLEWIPHKLMSFLPNPGTQEAHVGLTLPPSLARIRSPRAANRLTCMPSFLFPMTLPVARYTRFLLASNIVLAAFVWVGMAWMFLGSGQSRSSGSQASAPFAQQAQSVAVLLRSELHRVRQETRAAADLATHIFSNPESYRLAAQPGEYDYDQATGLYGSARNDGSSVVFLSAASALNPEILREIRLSEYLNPIFKTSATLNPLSRSVTLYTTDGLVRSYPWFDFKSRIASGALKRSFLMTDLSFFADAAPSRNPSKEGVWQVSNGQSKHAEIHLVCAAPFFAGENFRGVIAIEVDAGKLAAQLFGNLQPPDAMGLLIASDVGVLGTGRIPGSKTELSGLLTDVLKNSKVSGLARLEPLLKRLGNTDSFVGAEAGFYVAAGPAAGLPVKPVLVVPEGLISHDGAVRGASGLPAWLIIGTGLACGLLLVDAWWIIQTRRNLAEAERKLSESFTALSDLNLQSALVASPQGMLGDLVPRLNDGLDSIHKELEAGPADPAPEGVASFPEKVGVELKQIEHQIAVFCAFDAADSAQRNLNRLAAVLSSAFEVRTVTFFSYFGSALRNLPTVASASTEQPAIEWKEGLLFDALSSSRRQVSSNTLVLSAEEQHLLSPAIQGSYLAMPLLDNEQLVGAVVLSDKPSGISDADEAFLGALQAVLSKTVQNICQADDLLKLNQLRREYCLELAKALKTPLDRIRAEVQSIYDRLGKLTPYYKQHCETILFEVGKLYEMLREVGETETAVESRPADQAASPEVTPRAVGKKGDGLT